MQLQDRVTELRRVKASELMPNAANWRVHPESQRSALQGVLSEIGIADALLARELPDGRLELLDGHLRRDVEPDSEWPVLIVDLDDDEARLLLATLDPLAAMATADEQKLGELLAGLDAQDDGLRAMLDELAAEHGLDLTEPGAEELADPEPQIDRAAELQAEWGTALGQLWTIEGKAGEHRILCGDSTKAEDVERVMGGEEVAVVVTDPPYGTGHYATDVAINWDVLFAIPCRDLAVFGYPESLVAGAAKKDACPNEWICWFPSNWAAKTYNRNPGIPRTSEHIVIWGEVSYCPTEDKTAAGKRIAKSLGKDTGSTRAMPDVWCDPSPGIAFNSHQRKHPNEKPVSLVGRLLSLFSAGLVLDPFLGSGTTLVACEQLTRRGVGIEISPAYVAVALQRLKDMGLSPKLEGSSS